MGNATFKKIKKAKNYIAGGKMLTAFKIIFFVFSILMFVSVIRFSFYGDESAAAFTFTFNLIFMSEYCFFANAITTNYFTQKQRMMIKGCGSICDTMLLFPIRKRDCVRFSFRAWVLASLLPLSAGAVQNGALLLTGKYEERAGVFAFSAIIIVTAVALSLSYVLFSFQFKKKAMKIANVFVMLVYFLFLFFSIIFSEMDFMKGFYKMFSVFSGIPALILLVLIIPVMYILTKLHIKGKNSEAWYNE